MGRPKGSRNTKPATKELAPAPSLPIRISDTVSIDKIVDDCGKDTILSALGLSHNTKIQRFVELWRIDPKKSMDQLCLEADIPGDILIGTAAQLLVKVGASVTKIIMSVGHPKVMRKTVERALQDDQFDERMAFHNMMGMQTTPPKQPLLQQNFNLANQGVPTLAQCPDPINITPLSEETFDAPQEEDVPGTLSEPRQPSHP